MAPITGPAPPSAEIQQELGKILTSSAFSRPRRLARLLKHLVEHTLRGEQEYLKETVLGIEVFDRGQDFDPRTDPIVRIDARRLRARLAQYYSDEGAEDAVVIVLEPGSYAPMFRRRNEAELPAAAASSRTGTSVAVLPFVNLSDRPEYELFCEGLSEDILNRLAQNDGLRVIARTSAFQFRDPTRDPRQIARQLRVSTLVTGSLRSDRGEVRVTAQLVNAEDSTILWSQGYQHIAESMLETQETISRDVAARFQNPAQARVESSAVQPSPAYYSGNSAYRLFLQGRRLLHQGNREGYLQSMEFLEAAIKVDPTYAAAWGNLAAACSSLLMFRLRNPESLITRARFAAQKALDLDAHSPEAHAALGLVAGLADFNWLEARRWFDRALQINPLYGLARIFRAMLWYAPTAQLDEAEDELEHVLSNDPLNLEAMLNLGRVFYFERRYDMAVEMLQAVLDSNPQNGNAWIMLAFVREQMEMKKEALEAYRHWERLLSFSFTTKWTNAVEQILLGNPQPAERTARKMAWMARLTPFPLAGFVADLFLRVGNHDQAIEWLEKAHKERAIRLVCAAVEPAFDTLRKYPRFNRLVTAIMGDAAPNPAEQSQSVSA